MKKLHRLSTLSVSVLAATLLVASSASFAAHSYKGEAAPTNYKDAAPCPQPLTLKDGFYVGGQVGYDSYRMARSTSVSYAGLPGSITTGSGATAMNGFVGGLFLGYGQYFNNFAYLGLEVFGNDSGASQNTNSTVNDGFGDVISSSNKVSVNGSYGISLLPGLKLNDATLGYIRLGYNRANLKTSYSATATATPGGTGSASGSNTNWRGGFNYGLGIETAFYENWSARTEFTHTNFQSFSNNSTNVTPYDNQFMLGLIYHFA